MLKQQLIGIVFDLKKLFRSLVLPYIKTIKCELRSRDGLKCNPKTLAEHKTYRKQELVNAQGEYVNASYQHLQFYDIHLVNLHYILKHNGEDVSSLDADIMRYARKLNWLMGSDNNSVVKYTKKKLEDIENCLSIDEVLAISWDYEKNVEEMPS